MRNKIIFFVFTFLVLNSLIAQNEISVEKYLQWGDLKIPINELVNGSNGNIKLSLNTVLESASEPLVLMKNGKDAKLKSFYLIISKDNLTTSPKFVHIENYEKKESINIHGTAFIKEHLKEGQRIYFNNLKGEDLEEHFLSIQINYETPPLKLNFELPHFPTEEVFTFQIQEYSNERLKIRIDTADIKNERIFNSYKNYEKYDVIHIPNFRTTRRYLTDKEILKIDCKKEINLIENLQSKNIDLELISEFSDYNGHKIEIKWGEMAANNLRRSSSPTGNDGYFQNSLGEIVRFEDYDKYDLQEAIGKRFLLSQGFQTYQIIRMKIYIIPKNSAPISYETDNINHPELKNAFLTIDENTMILFSEIIIKNNANVILYFPSTFLFGIL